MTTGLAASTVYPDSLPIGVLFKDRAPLRIPRYQRPYAWEADAVDDLIEDVLAIMEPDQADRQSHFFGAMVAIQARARDSGNAQVYEVVDGQQRVTTFCLLISEIAQTAKRVLEGGDGEEYKRLRVFKEQTEEEYIYYERYDVDQGTRQRTCRLRLGEADDAMFQSIIAGNPQKPARASHTLLAAAAERIRERLLAPIEVPELSLHEKLDKLRILRDAVLERTFVIHIITEDERSGFRLFTVLNDRGTRLTTTDLLRSQTLERLQESPKLRQQVAENWDSILVRSGRDVDDFLRSYYPSIVGKRAKRDDLAHDVAENLLKLGENPSAQTIADHVSQIARESSWFFAIADSEWPYLDDDGSVSEWRRSRLFRLIGLLHHDLAMPLLLSARASISEIDFAKLVHTLERFAFRYKFICGAHQGAMSNEYYRTASALRTSHNTKYELSIFKSGLRSLLEQKASDRVFRNALKELSYGRMGERANIRELLTTLDEYWPWLHSGAQGKPSFQGSHVTDLKVTNIEHIYPIQPEERDESLEEFKHSIGNLTVWDTRDNKIASNKPFAEKKPYYSVSSFSSTRQLYADYGEWNKANVRSRTELLIDYACKVFVID